MVGASDGVAAVGCSDGIADGQGVFPLSSNPSEGFEDDSGAGVGLPLASVPLGVGFALAVTVGKLVDALVVLLLGATVGNFVGANVAWSNGVSVGA